MSGKWITTTGLILCILITWTCAIPLQKNTGGDQDSEEGDSEEEETTTVQSAAAAQNVTDQELTNKATLFLTRYFSNHGTEAPLHIPTNLNHTIVITIVPNNASTSDFQNVVSEGPPTFGGDIPFYPSSLQEQYQTQQQLQLFQNQQQLQQQLQQYQFQPAILQQYQSQQQLQQQTAQTSPLQQQQSVDVSSFQQPQQQVPNNNLTPLKDLFGFVREEQLPPFATRQVTEAPANLAVSSTQPTLSPATATWIAATTTTTTTTTTTSAPPVKEEPVDNIEDAILEALSIAEGGGGQASSSSSSQSNNNFQNLIQSGVIPGLSSGGGGAIHVPSNFGSVFIEPEEQSTVTSGGTVFVNQNTPAPPSRPAGITGGGSAGGALNPNIAFLQHLNGQGPNAINAVSGILGSISEGNLQNLVQNSIKLAEAPLVQNTAKLATVAILHNVFQGLNPCNFLGNCRPRPPLKKK